MPSICFDKSTTLKHLRYTTWTNSLFLRRNSKHDLHARVSPWVKDLLVQDYLNVLEEEEDINVDVQLQLSEAKAK